ncbi:MAG: ABC transporter permease [Chloroflexota bacterium]|nr:ABC transporter permease [Chloroflexota bacterium]MDE2696753.1 ABC transporter permease [Chloroflexota bacterium]MXZ47011.1 ABC transporter permease [Chloroflexota bacterium]
MTEYIIRRLLSAIPSLVLVSIIIFSLVRLVPGDVVMARLAEGGYADEEQLAAMRADLGIDRPFVTQYIDWASKAIRGDFGESLWDSKPVLPTIAQRMRVSIQIAIMAIVISIGIAIPMGVISAVKQDTVPDYAARLFAIIGLSMPDFWLATMLLLALTLWIGWLPEFGYFPLWEDPSRNLQALIFPALIVGYRLSATASRMTRSSMLEVLREDYVRTARSKGLQERTIIVRHALKNALIPVITIFGGLLSFMLGGLVVIETIFALPGMGRLALNAVLLRDYPVLQGTVMVMAVIFVTANLIVDLSYAVIDPRIRYQ